MTMRNRRLQDRPPARRTPHLRDPVASVPRPASSSFGFYPADFIGRKRFAPCGAKRSVLPPTRPAIRRTKAGRHLAPTAKLRPPSNA